MIIETRTKVDWERRAHYRVAYVRSFDEGLADENPHRPMVHLCTVNNLLEAHHELCVDAHVRS
jgi:hypothetical protein